MEETPDMSKILEMVNMLKNTNSSNQNENTNFSNQPQPSNNFEMPDMETIMKINQIMKVMNSTENNASANLLYSLKPFLRKSKQEKIDQYVKMLKLSSVISEFNKNNNKETKLF